MGVNVYFNESWDRSTKKAIEDAIRKCIGEPPRGEDWLVTVTAGFAQTYCEVKVRTPNQTRSRFFFDEGTNLPKAIARWIAIYPLR
jgi:hypothetical protein